MKSLWGAALFLALEVVDVRAWQACPTLAAPTVSSRQPGMGRRLNPRTGRAVTHTRLHNSLQEGTGGGKAGGLFDGLVRLLTSETLSLSVGSLGLLVLTWNRLATETLYDSQSRTDILGVIAAGGLLLNGLTLQDITARDADEVQVTGKAVRDVDPSLSPEQQRVLVWAAETLMKALPNTPSVLIYYDGRTVLRQGVGGVQGDEKVKILSILNKAVMDAVPESDGISPVTYIPDLQILPGRTEFPYLPENTQSVVLQPFGERKGVLIIGGNKARNLTPRELTRVRMLTQKIQSTLAK